MFSVFLISSISAVGIVNTGDSAFNILKNSGENKSITLKFRNSENFSFFNVSIEDNNILIFPKINELLSNEERTINAPIFGSNNFNGELRLKGFYQSNLPQLNENHLVNVNFNSGVDICDFSITKGDSVTWRNNIDSSSGNIKLINFDTNLEVATITSLSNHTEIFNSPSTFSYFFTRLGVPFTENCKITILDTQGLINNPELDMRFSLNLTNIFEPTTIQLTILENSYTINALGSTEDILNIKNTGNKTAKGVILSGDWFSFSENNFDLSSGQSKNIQYVISPVLSNSNDTNKIYTKELKVSGNFNTQIYNFSIFIPFSQIEDILQGALSLDELAEDRFEFIKSYCKDNPSKEICKFLKENAFNSSSSSPFGQSFLDIDFVKGFIEFMDRQDQQNAFNRENDDAINSTISLLSNETQQIKELSQRNLDENKTMISNVMLLATTILFVVLVSGLSYLIFSKRQKNKYKSFYQTNG